MLRLDNVQLAGVLRDGVSATIGESDRIGLIGSGAKRMLQVIAGVTPPSGGRLRCAPGLRISYLPSQLQLPAASVWQLAASALEPLQALEAELRRCEAELDSPAQLERYGTLRAHFEALGGYRAEGRLKRLLVRYGIGEALWGLPAAALTAAQQQRLTLAAALATPAELLCLELPGELAAELAGQLASDLARYRGAVVVAASDRALLAALGGELWQLEGGQLAVHRPGTASWQAALERLAPPEVAEPPAEPPTLEQLEDERALLEEALCDPLRVSAREYARQQARYRELTELLMQRYDATLPPPAPRYQLREGDCRLWADLVDGTLQLCSHPPARMALRRHGRIYHIILAPKGDELPLAAHRQLVNLLARLAFCHLDATAVQHQSDRDLSGGALKRAAGNWWVASRSDYERQQGYLRHP